MPASCSICFSSQRSNGVLLKLHRAPADEERFEAWKQSIPSLKKGNRVCSKHFSPSDYNEKGSLKLQAVPVQKKRALQDLASISNNFSTVPSDNVSEGTIFKITNVQSGMEIKIENEEPPSLKVKSIFEINQTPSTTHQQKQQLFPMNTRIIRTNLKPIVVKRLGNTTIKPVSIVSRTAIEESLKAARSPSHPQNVVEIPAAKYTNENYIKYLEDQNKELTKLLIDTRQEAMHLGTRLNSLADTLNSVILKMSSEPPPQQTYLIQNSQPPEPPASTSDSQASNDSSSKTNNNAATVVFKRNQTLCHIPVFPIKGPNSLKQFEMNLGDREFNQHVYNKLFNANKDMDITKGEMLSATLRSIINLEVLGFFHWDQIKDFTRFKELYVRLISSFSNLLYGKNVDGGRVEQFLRTKVIEQGKLRQQKLDRAATDSQNMRVIKIKSSENETKLLYVDMDNEKAQIVQQNSDEEPEKNDDGEEEDDEKTDSAPEE